MNYLICMKPVGTEDWIGIAEFVWWADAKLFWDLLVVRDPKREFDYRMLNNGEVVLEDAQG